MLRSGTSLCLLCYLLLTVIQLPIIICWHFSSCSAGTCEDYVKEVIKRKVVQRNGTGMRRRRWDDSRETSSWECATIAWCCWLWCSDTETASEDNKRVKVLCYYSYSAQTRGGYLLKLLCNLKVVYDPKLQAKLYGHYRNRDFWPLWVSYCTSSVSSNLNSQALSRIYCMLILEGWLLCAWPIYSLCFRFSIAYFKTRHFP